MIALLAALLAQTTVPEPTRKTSGVDLATLTKTVAESCQKEIQFGSDLQLDRKFVNISGGDMTGLSEIFQRYQQALLNSGFGLIRDPRSKSRYSVVRLGQPLPFLPEEFTDLQKLPPGEEICTLTIRLTSISANQALGVVRNRLNPSLVSLNASSSQSLTLTDLASTLSQVGRLLLELDRTAAECTRPLEVEMWVISVFEGTEAHAKEKLPTLEPLLKNRYAFTEKTVLQTAGHGSCRLSPYYRSPVSGELDLDESLDASFQAEIERGQAVLTNVHLQGFRLVSSEKRIKETIYRTGNLQLAPGKPVILSTWKTEGSTQVLIAQVRIGE